jgi:pyruvate ferredoxin oxidoreductase alpha subunit
MCPGMSCKGNNHGDEGKVIGTRMTVEGSKAIALSVANCDPDVVACYPITPSGHIAEELDKLYTDAKIRNFIASESEFGAISILLGASAAGARTFTATSAQGLALMHEVLFTIAGMRLPVVMAVGNRALSAPLNIWNDHQDTVSERDSGWIQLYCESNQEACDSIYQAYKIAESTLIPVMVCVDGYYLTHAVEPLLLLNREHANDYLPKFNPKIKLDPKDPLSLGVYAFPDDYQDFREDLSSDVEKSAEVIRKDAKDFGKQFGRTYDLVDSYRCEDADRVLVGMGGVMGNVKEAVDGLRQKGEKVGALRIRCMRPFPRKDIERALAGKTVGVFEKAISIGAMPPLFTEVSEITGCKTGFIGGLGGRDITINHVNDMFAKLKDGKKGISWIK